MPQPPLTADVLGGIFAEHGDRLVSYFMRRTFDAEASFDLAAETFAEAVACRDRFVGDISEHAVAWLYGIARNQLHSFSRRGAVERRALHRLGLERPALSLDDIDRIAHEAGLEELRSVVQTSMAELPEHHREALRLRVLEDRTYTETAATLEISEQTARAHVSRALRRLAQIVPPTALVNFKEGLS
jgi:RNA polymerase sigma-70 factor (ECF subfamily)